MATAPFLVTVSGNRNNKAVTTINVRSGPGTGNDAVTQVPVGTANLAVLDVRADEKGIGLNNKIYQWFKVALTDGKQGWMRDDLIDIVGNGSQYGYGMIAQATNAFSLTRIIEPVGVAPAVVSPALATPAAPAAAPATGLDRVRKAAFNITSAFEGGGYATYQNYDSGIISYGRFQFTLAAGNLTSVVRRYTERSTSPVAEHLKAYLPRISAKDEGLRKDPELKAQLVAAADDPVMQAVQDEVATEGFWQSVIDLSITPRNIQTALGYALLFDMAIQHGRFNFLVPKADEVLGLPAKPHLPKNGITEQVYIAKVAELRRDNLYALATKLNLPGMRPRGDFWVALVASGDWDLQGDADGNLSIKSKIRQVRNP